MKRSSRALLRFAFVFLPLAVFVLLAFQAFSRGAEAQGFDLTSPPDLSNISSLFGTYGAVALILVSLVSTVASGIVALTPTPHPDTAWGRVYQVVELLAMVTKNTKQTGFPVVDALHNVQLALAANPLPTISPPLKVDGPDVSVSGRVVVPSLAIIMTLGIGLLCSACDGSPSAPAPNSPEVQSFAQQVAAFNAKVKADMAAFGAASLAVGKSSCGYLSEANGLFKAATPVLLVAGVDPAIGGTEAGVMLGVDVACGIIDAADPTAPATPQVASAIAQVVAAIPEVKAALATAAPDVAATASAPPPDPAPAPAVSGAGA